MKLAMLLPALLLVVPAAYGDTEIKTDPGPGEIVHTAIGCESAAEITCNDVIPGTLSGASAVAAYGCSGLDYSACGEAVYELCVAADDDVTINLTYQHLADNDLDLFLLSECDEAACLDSSLGTTGLETIGPLPLTAGTYYVVVDGWNGNCAAPDHTVSIVCDAPCESVAVDPSTWGEVKGLYR